MPEPPARTAQLLVRLHQVLRKAVNLLEEKLLLVALLYTVGRNEDPRERLAETTRTFHFPSLLEQAGEPR